MPLRCHPNKKKKVSCLLCLVHEIIIIPPEAEVYLVKTYIFIILSAFFVNIFVVMIENNNSRARF